MNKLKQKLDNGEIAIGVQLRSASERIAEVLALLGFDFIYVETEHYCCDDLTLEGLFRTIKGAGSTPIVRIPTNRIEQASIPGK